MTQEFRRRRRLHGGTQTPIVGQPYPDPVTAGQVPVTEVPQGGSARPRYHFTVSPEELGVIGAELTKRLTFAAEEFLTEMVEHQVRDAFRQELAEMLHLED